VIGVFGILQIVLLVLWATGPVQRTRTSVAAAALAMVDSFAFLILSYSEHAKSVRPSALLSAYLFFSILLDAVRTRTLWLMSYGNAILGLFTASLTLKVAILALEEISKRRYIDHDEKTYGPEETSGIFSHSLFLWLNGVIMAGYRKVLSVDDLIPIDRRLCSERLWTSFGTAWHNCRLISVRPSPPIYLTLMNLVS
jgi:ATP-binding cassette, subfamily C (CFTR/MRP), member 1